MNPNKNELQIVYDREADVLYVPKGTPEHTDYVEYADDVIRCFHPETKQLVGFTRIDFLEHFAKTDSGPGLPFTVNFQMHDEVHLPSYED